jgi:NADH-quinone oxidoreductase subunit A
LFEERVFMVETYAPLLLMLVIAFVVVVVFFAGSHFLGPKKPSPEKSMPFESGNPSAGASHLRMSVKFFLTAISFVVFDVEVVFLYIWAVHYRSLGGAGLAMMTAFLAMLIIGLVYELRKGALEWEK